MIEILALGYEDESLAAKAQQLADALGFRVDKDANPCLFLSKDRLTLKINKFSLLAPEFRPEFWNKRRQDGKKQGLVRACKPAPGVNIIDATAGWGRDAAVLASFGAEVLMLERHPVMAALLADALKPRSIDTDVDLKEVEQKMPLSFCPADAYDFLKVLEKKDYPDVIYIDPMHPERNKAALVKKDMQALQQMIGVDEDSLKLIELAITRVQQRVVVKWPQKSKPLLEPTSSIEGKTVRFDIYVPRPANKSEP